MAKFSKISKENAPKAPRNYRAANAETQKAFDAHVQAILSLPKDEVTVLHPEKDETPRSVRLNLAQAAKRADVRDKIKAWIDFEKEGSTNKVVFAEKV